MYRIIAQNINHLMESQGMTQTKLAEMTGISRAAVRRLTDMSGNSDVRFSTLHKVTNALDSNIPTIVSRGMLYSQPYYPLLSIDEYLKVFSDNASRIMTHKNNSISDISNTLLDLGIEKSDETIRNVVSYNIHPPLVSTLIDISNALNEELASMFIKKEDSP